jgi:hypothetical protein
MQIALEKELPLRPAKKDMSESVPKRDVLVHE